MKRKFEKELLETQHKNPANWRGPLYFNRKDPRLTVPKINGAGWTFNLSSPYSWILLLFIILIIVASQYWL